MKTPHRRGHLDVGDWSVDLVVDNDNHLSIFVNQQDKSKIHEVDTEMGGDKEWAVRLTTEAIESSHKQKRYNTMFDVAFTVEHDCEEIDDIDVEDLIAGLERRLLYLKQNPIEAKEAFGVNDTIELPIED